MLIGSDTYTDQPVSKSDLERMLFVFNVKEFLDACYNNSVF